MSENHTPQPRTPRGRFSDRDRPESEVALVLGDTAISRTIPEGAAHKEVDERTTSMTTNLTFEIDDTCVVLPDQTWAEIYLARREETNLDHLATLEATSYAWLGAASKIGTALDDRDSMGLFRETVEFLSPEGDILTVPACDAGALARRYREVHGLFVREVRGGVWRVEMVEWGE